MSDTYESPQLEDPSTITVAIWAQGAGDPPSPAPSPTQAVPTPLTTRGSEVINFKTRFLVGGCKRPWLESGCSFGGVLLVSLIFLPFPLSS